MNVVDDIFNLSCVNIYSQIFHSTDDVLKGTSLKFTIFRQSEEGVALQMACGILMAKSHPEIPADEVLVCARSELGGVTASRKPRSRIAEGTLHSQRCDSLIGGDAVAKISPGKWRKSDKGSE